MESRDKEVDMEQMDRSVRHRRLDLDGIDVFYREAGADDAPVLLLPHGYPCSVSYTHLTLPTILRV